MRNLFLVCLIVPFMMVAQNDKKVLNLTSVTVKMGHEAHFMEGMKMYKKCYADNKGDGQWNAWSQVQGTGMTMVFTDLMDSWSEMDDEYDAASNSCRGMFNEFIMPYVSSYERSMATTMPKMSPDAPVVKDKVWVTYFQVNNPSDFLDAVATVGEALEEIEGDKRGYWYMFQGGTKDAPDYMVAWPFEKYADLDIEMDGVWEVCAKKHGEKKMNEVRTKFRNALDNSWSLLYDKNDDITLITEVASN